MMKIWRGTLVSLSAVFLLSAPAVFAASTIVNTEDPTPISQEENASVAQNNTTSDQPDFTADIDSSDLPPAQRDPLEKMNRAFFKFNDFFDNYFLKPTSELYSKIMPKPLAKGVSNFFSNIDMVPTVLNDLLMGNFYQATSDTWRFAVNTTIGIGGLFDVASHIGLEPNTEDFGLTLAKWGWTDSAYLVIPFMGPSTIRDGAGSPVNYYVLSVYPYIKPNSAQYGLYALGVVSRRADLIHYQEVLDSVAIDKYIFMRDAYLQRRNYLIQRNKELNNPYLAKAEDKATAKKEQQAVIQTKPFSSI
jgi:phospholipid-binding lipoprotein MlaA